MFNKSRVIKFVSIFFTSLMFLVTVINFISLILDTNKYAHGPDYIYFLIFVNSIFFVVYFITIFDNRNWVCVVHVVGVILTGMLATLTSTSIMQIIGPMFFSIAFCLARVYELPKDKFLKLVIGLYIFSLVLRIISSLNYGYFEFKGISGFFILTTLIFFSFGFFAYNSYEISKIHALSILKAWDEKKIFIELGERIYTDVYHNFNGGTIIDLLHLVKELSARRKFDELEEIVTELERSIKRYNNSFYDVREEVVNCQKKVPVIINIGDFFNESTFKGETVKLKTINNPKVLLPKYDLYGIIEPIIFNGKYFKNKLLEITVKNDMENLYISILNDGKPIDNKYRDRDGNVDMTLFQPNSTTRLSGTGWGLFSAYNKVLNNSCKMIALSDKSFTEFNITIPLYKRG